MKAHIITEDKTSHTCPTCGGVLNAATGAGHDAIPVEGDITICSYCGEILNFGERLKLYKISSEKLKEIKYESPEDYKLILELSNHFKNKRNV